MKWHCDFKYAVQCIALNGMYLHVSLNKADVHTCLCCSALVRRRHFQGTTCPQRQHYAAKI